MLLYIAVIVLIALWLLGLLTGRATGFLPDVLLVVAAILILSRCLVLVIGRFNKK
ncbi:MAG: lmo0937 family membrane protein [Verrucomicrobiales bacterium]|jgi:hypothetical protein|nr:lmo0937 family membrane protein [Verrucomicrobiales bacterium]